MNKYCYQVTLRVEVNSFDEDDAREMLQDAFGVGENCGTMVTDCEYTQSK